MATETDFPHKPSLREMRERGWAYARQGQSAKAVKLLKQARLMEEAEAKRVESLKAQADRRHGIKRND